MRYLTIMIHISPQYLLAFATLLFLVGCVIGAFWPNRWRLAVAIIVPASLLSVALTFGLI